MKASSTAQKIVLVLVSMLLLTMSGTLAWAVMLDYQSRGFVTDGVSVVGNSLGGMTEEQAREAIEGAVSAPMLAPLTVSGDQRTWTFDPRGVVTVDVDAMLDAAYAPRYGATLTQRLSNQLVRIPLSADIEPIYSIDTSAVADWVATTAAEIDRKPVNAKRTIAKKYKLKIKPAVPGAKVDREAAVAAITEALSADSAISSANRVVSLPIAVRKAKITESSFKQAIVVSLSQTRIWLYDGAKVEKTYRCAPGAPAYPTPTGDFEVNRKLANAPWINPGSAWAKDMPPIIPGGPGNPMGVRKIGINAPAIYFHGIPPSAYSSIGTHASHGCLRMMPSDVLDLYGRVEIGVPVFIRP